MQYLRDGFIAEDTVLEALTDAGIPCKAAPTRWDHAYKIDVLAKVANVMYLLQVKFNGGMKNTRPAVPPSLEGRPVICKTLNVVGHAGGTIDPADITNALINPNPYCTVSAY